jgi:hypothetical protein
MACNAVADVSKGPSMQVVVRLLLWAVESIALRAGRTVFSKRTWWNEQQ